MITLDEIRKVHEVCINMDKADNPDDYAAGERYTAPLEAMLEYNVSDNNSCYHNAAVALKTIAAEHPFFNGNKRTAIVAALIMLRNEGLWMSINDMYNIQFIIDIATPQKEITLEQIENWLIDNTTRMV
jgi:death on curing protein